MNDGSIVDLDGSSLPEFGSTITLDLYLALWQRNHLGVLSNSALTSSGGIYTYDFTDDETRAFGGISGHKELLPGIWGMISGDSDGDGMIGSGDKSAQWDNQAGSSGYLNSDFNLDTQSNNIDKDEFWVPNLGSGSQVPN